MNFIIKVGENYFCGWNMFGSMKFIDDRRLAYRMRRNVAETTLAKVQMKTKQLCKIETL